MTARPPARRAVVIGVGSPDRGDDAAGPLVARRLQGEPPPGADVLICEDPSTLLHAWEDYDVAVVVDAVASGRDPGTLTIRDVGASGGPLPTSAWAETGRGGTHAFGLATAVELARSLHRLPHRVVVVGVEAAQFDHGAPLTPEVEAAISDAEGAVRLALAECGRGVA